MKKGFTLIAILAVLVMIALGAAALLQSGESLTAMKVNNIQDIKAQYLAEAGMQRALWLCRTTGCVDELTYSVDGQTVIIDVTPNGTNFDIDVQVNYADA